MRFFLRSCVTALLLAGAAGAWAQPASRYTNPLPLRLADGSLAESCADPALLRDRTTVSGAAPGPTGRARVRS